MNEKSKNNETRAMPGPRGGHGPGGRVSFEKPKNAKGTSLRLLNYLSNWKWVLLVVIVLMLLSTASMLAGNYFLKPLINNYILPGDFSGLGNALLGLAAIYLVGVVATYGQSRLMIQVAQRTANTLRRDLFEKMQSLPLRYFDSHTHGELMSRYTNDMDNVQMALEQSLVQLISSILSFVGSVVMMIVLSPILFVITALVLVLMIFITQKIAGKSRDYFKAQQKNLGDVNGYIEEMVDGLKVVKVFNYEGQAITEFKQRNEAYRQATTNANFYAGVVFPVVGNLNNISYAATALFGGILSILNGFDIGSLAAFLQYSRQMGFPVMQITNQLNTVLAALAGAERVFDVMDQKPEVDEGTVTLVGVNKKADGSIEVNSNGHHPTHWAWKYPQADGSIDYIELKGDVRFNDVLFGYEAEKINLRQTPVSASPLPGRGPRAPARGKEPRRRVDGG